MLLEQIFSSVLWFISLACCMIPVSLLFVNVIVWLGSVKQYIFTFSLQSKTTCDTRILACFAHYSCMSRLLYVPPVISNE